MIGGMNMDIGGFPNGRLVLRDSNPGRISLRPGGVGRNIAHDLRLLGLEVSLVSALGDDLYGRALLDSCAELGLDTDMCLISPGDRSSVYLYVTDETGDMQVGLSDMDVTGRLTPAYLEPLLDRLNRADALVLDGNLPEETLLWLADHCTAPLCADPVSTVKAARLAPVLDRLYAFKPNALEARALTGEKDPARAAEALLRAGVRRVFISLGAEGLLTAGEGQSVRLAAERTRTVNANGAGDAATAAIVWAGIMGLDLKASARAAVLAGAATAASAETNTPAIRAAWQAAGF